MKFKSCVTSSWQTLIRKMSFTDFVYCKWTAHMFVYIVQPYVTTKQCNQHTCLSILCNHMWPQNNAINTHVCLYCTIICDHKPMQSTHMFVYIVQSYVTTKQCNQHTCLSVLYNHMWPQNNAINTHVCLYCTIICDHKTMQSTHMFVYIAVLTLATRMFVINEKLFLFAIVDRYPFATCAKDIFV